VRLGRGPLGRPSPTLLFFESSGSAAFSFSASKSSVPTSKASASASAGFGTPATFLPANESVTSTSLFETTIGRLWVNHAKIRPLLS